MGWRNVVSRSELKKPAVAAILEVAFQKTGTRASRVTRVKLDAARQVVKGSVLVKVAGGDRRWRELGVFEASVHGDGPDKVAHYYRRPDRLEGLLLS